MKVCGQVEHGILALFGPSDPLLGSHIASICDALDIPHLESRNDIEDAGFNEFSLNLHPSQDLMNQAYKVRGKFYSGFLAFPNFRSIFHHSLFRT